MRAGGGLRGWDQALWGLVGHGKNVAFWPEVRVTSF